MSFSRDSCACFAHDCWLRLGNIDKSLKRHYSSFCAKFIKLDFFHGSLYFCCKDESINFKKIILFSVIHLCTWFCETKEFNKVKSNLLSVLGRNIWSDWSDIPKSFDESLLRILLFYLSCTLTFDCKVW